MKETETQKAIEQEASNEFREYAIDSGYGLVAGGRWENDNGDELELTYQDLIDFYIAGRSKSLERERELEEALMECEEYFDSRADADHNGENFVPNKEMTILSMIRQLIN